MPPSTLMATDLTTPGSAPYSLYAGPYDLLSTAVVSLPDVPIESIRAEDTGTSEVGVLEFDLVDMALLSALTDAMPIRFDDNVTPRTIWTGEIIARAPGVNAIGQIVHVTCHGLGLYLDRTLVPADRRSQSGQYDGGGAPAAESDLNRVDYLLGAYGDRIAPDASLINKYVIKRAPGLLPQRFLGLNLRQAVESVAAQAGTTILVTLDPAGRLVYITSTAGSAAPYALRVGTPGGGEMAPEDLSIETDSQALINAYYVKGATAAGSGWVTDATSIQAYGRHEDYIDAPDADTAAKRDAVGNAALADTKNPTVRGSFSATSPYDGWVSGQQLTINSAPQFGISSPVVYRITSVVWTFLDGTGNRHYDISFGAPPASFVRTA